MIRSFAYERFGEHYRTLRLPSGFEITHYHKPFSLQAAFLSVDYGSMHRIYTNREGVEISHPMGSAHFLEHKLFESAPGDIAKKMAELGVSVNAYTSHERTCFYFFGRSRFDEALALLLELPFTASFTEEGIENEKLIIAREIEHYEDDIASHVFRQGMEVLFPDHLVSEEILGTVESIQSISRDTLESIVQDCYTPSRMQLLLIGNYEEGILERIVARLPKPYTVAQKATTAKIASARSVLSQQIVTNRDIALPSFAYIQKLPNPKNARARALQHLQWEMALEAFSGQGSPLYTRQYAKGNIFSLSAYTVDLPGAGFFCINGEGRRPDRFLKSLREGLARLGEEGIDPLDVDRLRKKKIGDELRGFDDYAELSFRFLDQRHTGLTLFEETELLFRFPKEILRLPPGEWVYSVVSKEKQ